MNIITCLQETISNRNRYLGGDSILKLECFAYGYMESLRYNGLVEPTGPPFQPFLLWLAFHKNGNEWKFGWSMGWGKTLLHKFDGDEDKAFEAFRILLDEYASFVPVKRATIPVPVGGGGSGMHLRFKRDGARIPIAVDVFQLSPRDFCFVTYTYEAGHCETEGVVYPNVEDGVISSATLLGIEVPDWTAYEHTDDIPSRPDVPRGG